jgi:hypothetical protein
MAIELSSNSQTYLSFRRLRSARILLPLLSIALLAFVACGTDNENEDAVADAAPAAPIVVNGDTLTWSPPWQAGDTRSVTTEASTEFSPAIQQQFESSQQLGMSLDQELQGMLDQQSANVGTVSFISADSSGAKAKLDIAFQELLDQMMSNELLEEPGPGDSDSEMFSAMMGLVDQIDLGMEFDLDNSGAHSGVTNLAELSETASGFIDSVMALAALAGEETIDPDDRAKMDDLLAALPDTEAAQVLADMVLNMSTANMFLMRSGEYTVGQPVAFAGTVPTTFGFETEGHAIYELTDVLDGTATVEVEVSPAEVDVLALVEQYAAEIAVIVDEDISELTDSITGLEPDERSMAELLAGVLFNPYTVMLTLDSSTGWVTAASWDLELALPEGFEELIPEEERGFEEFFDLSDFGVTISMSSTFN